MIALERRGLRPGLVIVVLALGFFHFLLGPLFDTWFASPNLLACAVLVAARQLRPGAAAGVGFALGLLDDSLAVSHFGLAALLLLLLGYLGSLTRDLFVGEEPLFMGAYLLAGTWLYEAVSYLAVGGGSLSFLFLRAPLDALATGAVGYLALPFVRQR